MHLADQVSPSCSDSFAGDGQRFAQRVDVADVVGQQQDQPRIEQFDCSSDKSRCAPISIS
jgi:hypothetical protein